MAVAKETGTMRYVLAGAAIVLAPEAIHLHPTFLPQQWPDAPLEISLAPCETAKACYDRGFAEFTSKRWGGAAYFLNEARKLFSPRRDVDTEYYLAIAQVNSIRERYQKDKAEGFSRAEENYQQLIRDYLGNLSACPTHATCIRLAKSAFNKGDYQTALANYKRALFRSPGSEEASEGILAATIKICKDK